MRTLSVMISRLAAMGAGATTEMLSAGLGQTHRPPRAYG